MRKNKAFVIFVSALIISSMCACGSDGNGNDKNSKPAVVSEETVPAHESDETSDEISREESSSQSSDESRSEESSLPDESSVESSAESSEESQKESSGDASGYKFEEDTSEKDYENIREFTEDPEFNALFDGNSVDQQYQQDAKTCETIADMRNLAMSYGEKWKEQVTVSYDKLYELLSELPDEREKLFLSQQKWNSLLEETVSGFVAKYEQGGSYGLLSADTAIMNYYKFRAAFLYRQIYKLTGSFSPEI